MPRQNDSEKGQDGGDDLPAGEVFQVAGEEQIEKSDNQGKNGAGEPPSEDAQGATDSEADGAFEDVLFLMERTPEEVEGEGEPEAKEDVAQKEMAEEEDSTGSEEGERGVEGRGRRVEEAAPE